MKTKLFFILITGFALSLLSCNSDPAGTPNDEKEVDTYGATGLTHDPRIDPRYPDGKPDMGEPGFPGGEQELAPHEYLPDIELAFSVDDIFSYNIETREIVFTDIFSKKLTTPNEEGIYRNLTFYYNDEPLLEEIIITSPWSSNPWRGYIVLFIGNVSTPNYPFLLLKNTQEYQAEWDIFIKTLEDASKIVK